MAVNVTWQGHGTLFLNVDGELIVVDPYFTDCPTAIIEARQVTTNYVLITHGHGDHVGDAVSIAKRCDALVISNTEICNWISAQGHEKVQPQHIGGGHSYPFGHVKLTLALHGSALPDGSYGGMPAGFVVTAGGKRIYIAGDTAVYSDMELIGRPGLDLAILPIGDNYTMGPDDALLAVQFLRPKVVMPYHFDTWPVIEQDVQAWAERVRAETDTAVVVLPIGGSYEV